MEMPRNLRRADRSGRKLRERARINYCEREEPPLDHYIFCEECGDYVFEYCAIHGPLLVIPDDKPARRDVPSVVPRAALTIPHVFLHLAPSIIPGAGIGVFSTLTLPRGVRFGPYRGQRAHSVDSMYCWQIYDADNKRSHVLDAADAQRSNWMRYVNCARHWTEQNLVAYQYRGQLYYRSIKIIPRFTELLVFYGTEFAHALHVDLRKYNCAQYYKDVIKATSEINDITTVLSSTESNTSNIPVNTHTNDEQLLNFDDFQIIDEDQITTIESEDNTTALNNKSIDPQYPTISYANENSEINNMKHDSRFQCDKCDKSFAKIKYLRAHYRRHTQILKYQCSECPYSTPFKYSFNRHTSGHANRQIYSCELCLYKTKIINHFTKHSSQHELSNRSIVSISYYSTAKKCDVCQFETYSRKSYQTHVLKHRGDVYQCELCVYTSYAKANLKQHLLRKHGRKD